METACSVPDSNGVACAPEALPPPPDTETGATPSVPHGRNYAWAELMRRVFSFDVLACDRCGGKLRIVAAIHPPEATRKILDWLRLPFKYNVGFGIVLH